MAADHDSAEGGVVVVAGGKALAAVAAGITIPTRVPITGPPAATRTSGRSGHEIGTNATGTATETIAETTVAIETASETATRTDHGRDTVTDDEIISHIYIPFPTDV